MPDKRPVVVYGASGFSGRLVVEFLREYNVPFVAAGRDRSRLEEVLDHVPGISTADYEIVEVAHSVEELTKLFKGASVVCNTVGPCIYYGDTVIEACLAAGCHYIDTGGEAPWVRRVRETWHAKFAKAGLLVAPATAYMSATAEAAIRVAQQHAPGIDTIEVLSMFMGMPTYGSTQTIFGQLQWESFYLEQNEYVEWPPVTTIEALIPGEFRTRLALPWGGFPHPTWFKDDPRIANVYAFGGLLDRSLMENVVAARLPGEDPPLAGRAADEDPRGDRGLGAGGHAAAREPPAPAHDRRRLGPRQPRLDPGRRARARRVSADGADPGVRRSPPRLPAAARGRLRVAVLGVRPPGAARRARGIRIGAPQGRRLVVVNHVLVLADDLEATRAFYCDTLGFEQAETPELPFPGFWLALDGHVCVHVAEREAYEEFAATLGLAPAAGPLDHAAFRRTNGDELAARLERAGVDVVSNEVPGLFRQLFVADPNGLRIELQVPLDG